MTILWDINHAACAWDILERWEAPKPAYTTIATYLKVLHEKGFVEFFKNKGEGKTHQYVAKVTRAEYTRQAMQEVKKNFFDGINTYTYDYTLCGRTALLRLTFKL